MSNNPLVELNRAGQSVWLDFISRDILNSGHLKRMIEEDALSGVTSNPTIFDKAISGSEEYDAALKDLLARGVRDTKEIFLSLAMRDVSDAADLFNPTYEATGGMDGFVSIEVSPDLAYNTGATVEEARRLFNTIGKRNILVKVPATREGLPAIEQLISEGINVNVTLLFSVGRYEEVMDAYMRGLEKRAGKGEPLEGVASVASFFVSRVDTLVDKLLAGKEGGKDLAGKAAVANARLAYKKYRETFSSPRFLALKEKGAAVQRILWGSTSTKNPDYSDIKYVEEIIGADSINTIPEATIDAFRDHGKVSITIEDGLDEAEALPGSLSALGIDMKQVTDQLEEEGVKSFSDSFFALLEHIAGKRDRLA
jgi:transaldolase